ncbi:MAG: flagellar basal-body P-ring protein FlgI [Rickettsiaceae bacterium]|jgi:flagellar P-ring protein precursor FlgI|nr:flagellar basal-body P-ring protein FlgI [Rickettsiaceae bacterium]
MKLQKQSRNIAYKSALRNLESARELAGIQYIDGIARADNDNYAAKRFKSFLVAASIVMVVSVVLFATSAHSASRIKDIVYFEGVRENTLLGYGLVVGLSGTGDNLKNSPFTEKGLAQFLTKLGINSNGTNLKTKNVAAVTITATFPAFARTGSKFDITVSTLGDAKSLSGGVLLAAPLLGADGNVYGIAQGPVEIGGLITTSSSSNSTSKGVATSGFITNGAIVEKEIDFNLSSLKTLKLALRNPDISTARRISENINDSIGEEAAKPLDPGTVELVVPHIYGNNVMGLLADIEQLVIEPDKSAVVIVDEASGTVVMGEEVKIDTVAIAQGNLMVSINSNNADGSAEFSSDVSGANGTTKPVNANSKPGNGLAILAQGANLRDLVSGLNALGVGTRDLIIILQTIRSAGALHADIQIR